MSIWFQAFGKTIEHSCLNLHILSLNIQNIYITLPYHFIVLVPPKFLVTPQGHFFHAETINIGGAKGTIPSCLICVNCTVRGAPTPTMTWQYRDGTMSGFDYVITNQSNLSSQYYLQDNGQVSINALTTLLFHFVFTTEVMFR